MPRKEFVKLLEKNIFILDKLAARLRRSPDYKTLLPRQQMSILVRLYIGGRARLKDIADREMVTAPNLCATFRKLEHEKLVARIIDDTDRRNTWYEVTIAGEALAKQILENFRQAIEKVFSGISREDEIIMTNATRQMNNILIKLSKDGDK